MTRLGLHSARGLFHVVCTAACTRSLLAVVVITLLKHRGSAFTGQVFQLSTTSCGGRGETYGLRQTVRARLEER